MGKIEGFLEVGVNDEHEIVVNHPDLKPDANGVGHIVFSANQARNLAELLLRKVNDAESAIAAMKCTSGITGYAKPAAGTPCRIREQPTTSGSVLWAGMTG